LGTGHRPGLCSRWRREGERHGDEPDRGHGDAEPDGGRPPARLVIPSGPKRPCKTASKLPYSVSPACCLSRLAGCSCHLGPSPLIASVRTQNVA
jgi:hypothetical protein